MAYWSLLRVYSATTLLIASLLACFSLYQYSLQDSFASTVTPVRSYHGDHRNTDARGSRTVKSCDSGDVSDWTRQILENHTVSCGLEGLKKMALELSIGIGRWDKAHRNLASKILDLHDALSRNYQEQQSNKQHRKVQTKRLSQEVRSLGFIKAYKVAGTHISSLLVTYAYNHDLNIDPSGQWSAGKSDERKYNTCVDITGTHHPPPNFYSTLTQQYTSKYFCNGHVPFMFVRDPVERLWSAYNHYRVFYSTSIASFLRKDHETAIPPHHFLSTSFDKAVELSNSVEILSSDDMDTSLVILASTAGLSICDVMSAPCKAKDDSWGSNKCNSKKSLITDKATALIYEHAKFTRENAFHELAMSKFKAKAADPILKQEVDEFVAFKKEALKVCSSDLSRKAFETVLLADDNVLRHSDKKQWLLLGERYHPLPPSWICMQTYCRHKYNSDSMKE